MFCISNCEMIEVWHFEGPEVNSKKVFVLDILSESEDTCLHIRPIFGTGNFRFSN
jgi:hypothetical protein